MSGLIVGTVSKTDPFVVELRTAGSAHHLQDLEIGVALKGLPSVEFRASDDDASGREVDTNGERRSGTFVIQSPRRALQ